MAFDKSQVLYCVLCKFNWPIGTAVKPACPECGGGMQLATGTKEEVEEFVKELKG